MSVVGGWIGVCISGCGTKIHPARDSERVIGQHYARAFSAPKLSRCCRISNHTPRRKPPTSRLSSTAVHVFTESLSNPNDSRVGTEHINTEVTPSSMNTDGLRATKYLSCNFIVAPSERVTCPGFDLVSTLFFRCLW